MKEKGQVPLPILRMIVAAFLGIIIFQVVFNTLIGYGVDLNLSSILSVAAGFGSFTVIVRIPVG